MPESDVKAARTLDCTGFFCPMPIIKAKLELDTMKPGEILEVVADDPGFEKDLPIWCETTGQEFLGMKEENGVFMGYVKKKI